MDFPEDLAHLSDAIEAASAFIGGYAAASTQAAYFSDLKLWLRHCDDRRLDPLGVSRTDIEAYARGLERDGLAPATVGRRIGTIATFYRWCADEQPTGHFPAANLRRPKRPTESPRQGMSHIELKDWLDAAEAEGGQTYALACLLAINALRIGEVCRADVTDLSADRWHHTLAIVGKGDKPAIVPLPPRTVHALDQALIGRVEGPLLVTRAGTRMNRLAAARIVGRLARQVGVSKHITPHSLRHSAITAALNAGVPLRDVQEFARHGDPRTTIRYDRARHSLDRHASYTVMQYITGAA